MNSEYKQHIVGWISLMQSAIGSLVYYLVVPEAQPSNLDEVADQLDHIAKNIRRKIYRPLPDNPEPR
jgi:hypothetical protein